jgi:protein SFI1
MLVAWRIRLRSNLKLAKQARLAEKYLTVRRTWNIWGDKLSQKIRERKLEELRKQKLKKYLASKFHPNIVQITR